MPNQKSVLLTVEPPLIGWKLQHTGHLIDFYHLHLVLRKVLPARNVSFWILRTSHGDLTIFDPLTRL